MKDYSHIFPVEPIIGWTTTNYRDRSKSGQVQRAQGFPGCTLDGERLPRDYHDQSLIAVPEGMFHTGPDFFQPTPEGAIQQALEHVKRLNDESERILASVRLVRALHAQGIV